MSTPAKHQKRRLLVLVLKIVGVGFAGFVVITLLIAAWPRHEIMDAARVAYENSRPDPTWRVESERFATMGISCGDSATTVDARLAKSATTVIRQGWPLYPNEVDFYYSNSYWFNYGEQFSWPFFGGEEWMFIEVIEVRFDRYDQAVSVRRAVMRRDGEMSNEGVFVLCYDDRGKAQ